MVNVTDEPEQIVAPLAVGACGLGEIEAFICNLSDSQLLIVCETHLE
jgi:hypothetical protein